MLAHAFPRQGRWRPTPRLCTVGEVIKFALVADYGLRYGSVCPLQGRCSTKKNAGRSLEFTVKWAIELGKSYSDMVKK
jgi:hypothetical protein